MYNVERLKQLSKIKMLFFVIVTAFVAYKLFSILGQIDSEDRKRSYNRSVKQCYSDNKCKSADTYEKEDNTKPIKAVTISDEEAKCSEIMQCKFDEIRLLDPCFELGKFICGVKKAYKIITDAAIKGDAEVLRNLTNERVMRSFLKTLNDNRVAGYETIYDLKSIENVRVLNIVINGHLILILLEICCKRVLYVKDSHHNILSGSSDVVDITEEWTFSKHTSLNNNIWQLVNIR